MPLSSRAVAAGAVLLACLGCGGPAEPPAPAPVDEPPCPDCIWRDATARFGVSFAHVDARGGTVDYLPQTMGPGVAATDWDGDGLLDLFFVQGAGDEAAGVREPAGHLYRRTGEGDRLEEVGALAGLAQRGCGQAVLAFDFDNDGYEDLYVTRYGTANVLYRNNGDGTFTEVPGAAGAQGRGVWSSSATAVDRDRDGLLDLYVGGYLQFRREHWKKEPAWVPHEMGRFLETLLPGPYPAEPNLMLANRGGRFEDATADSATANWDGRTLGALAADLDGDGWPDLFVANDVSPCALFWNQRDGRFIDEARAAFVAEPRGSMGLALGDTNRDLAPDVLVSHWIGDIPALYERVSRTGRRPVFVDRARSTAIGRVPLDLSGWASNFVDLENTGEESVLIINGHTNPAPGTRGRLVAQQPTLLVRQGADFGFSRPGGPQDPLARPRVGRGAVFCDLDGDGTIDVAVASNNQPAEVWLHRPATGAWIELELAGAASNRDGLGARVELLGAGGAVRSARQVVSGDSYYSSNPHRVHFGLGAADGPVDVRVTWLSGRVEQFAGLAARRRHRLVESAGRAGR